jgi:hypothetical protein
MRYGDALEMALADATRRLREAREERVLSGPHSGACPWSGPDVDCLTADDCTCQAGAR